MKHYIGCDFAEPDTQDKSVFCVLAYDEKQKSFVVIEQGEFTSKTAKELKEEYEKLKHFYRASEFEGENVFNERGKDFMLRIPAPLVVRDEFDNHHPDDMQYCNRDEHNPNTDLEDIP